MMTPIDLIKFTPLQLHRPHPRRRNRVVASAGTELAASSVAITALDWLRKWAGSRVTDVIWEPLLRGKFDRYYDKVTMSWLWGA